MSDGEQSASLDRDDTPSSAMVGNGLTDVPLCSTYEKALKELVASYPPPLYHKPARLREYLVIGGVCHASKVDFLKAEYGVTHVFSCIHRPGSECIAEDLSRRKKPEVVEATNIRDALDKARLVTPIREVGSSDCSPDFNSSEYYASLGIKYYGVDSDDQDGYDMLGRHKEVFFDFCNIALQENPKACIYVHCAMGVNRSGCLAVAYLLHRERKELLTLLDELLRIKGGALLSNSSFRSQLVQFAFDEGLLSPLEHGTIRWFSTDDGSCRRASLHS